MTLVTYMAVEGMAFVVFFCMATFEEWLIHRYLMHEIILGWKGPYRSHTLIHHRIFDAGESYHIDAHAEGEQAEHKRHILFSVKYVVIFLVAQAAMAMAIQGLVGLPVFWGILAASVLYYVLFEYEHWCMHVPQGRWVEQTALFRWLDAHHRAHHRQYFKNLNVVFPLADYLLRTKIAG